MLCTSSFRAMMVVAMAMSTLSAAIGGATSGVLTALESEFGFSATQLAVVVVAYDIGSLIGAFPAGVFDEAIPRWVGCAFLVSAISLVGFGASSHLATLCITQFFAGLGTAVYWILLPVHIDNNVADKSHVSDYTGWLMAIAPFGVIAGFMVAGAFLTSCSDGKAAMDSGCGDPMSATLTVAPTADCASWRYPFILIGGCMVPCGVWFLFSPHRFPTPLPPSSPTLKQQVAEALEEEEEEGPAKGLAGAVEMAPNARLWLLVIGAGLHTFQSTALVSFGPRFMEKQLCVKRSTASLMTGGMVPTICLGVFLGGFIPKKRGWGLGKVHHNMLLMTGTTACSIPFVVLAFLSRSLVAFYAVVTIALGLMFVMSAPIITSVERVVDVNHRALAVALQNVAVRALGAIPGPLALGALLDHDAVSPRVAYIGIGVFGTVLASLLWLASAHLQRRHDIDDFRRHAVYCDPERVGLPISTAGTEPLLSAPEELAPVTAELEPTPPSGEMHRL